MKYRVLEMPEGYLQETQESEFVRSSLYYVLKGTDESLFFGVDDLYEVSSCEAYERVVSKLKEVIDEHKKIIISGDYDCDGICSTTLMYRYLKEINQSVGYYLPHRKNDGYGLSVKLVELYYEKGYEVIICVDNGVVAHEAIAKAKELGMEVIILDHHEMDEKSNEYDFILHPLLMEQPYHYLCGTGVVFEVLRSLKCVDEYDTMLAALAAISDMMDILGENRAVVKKGLKYLNTSKEPHLMAISEMNGLVDEVALGMKIAPKLNAVGRMYNLANVNTMVKYLLLDDERSILSVANQILNVNNERRNLTKQLSEKISAEINLSKNYLLYAGDIHEGIVGLIASSLVNEYHKPSFIFSLEDGIGKGSCRSVNGIDLIDVCRGNELLENFGGHKLAGGLCIKEENIENFEVYLDDYLNNHPALDDEIEVIALNNMSYSVLDLEDLNKYRPFIRTSCEPLYLISKLKLVDATTMKDGKHFKWKINNDVEAVYFNIPEEVKLMEEVSLICKANINEFRGVKKLSFIAQDYDTN